MHRVGREARGGVEPCLPSDARSPSWAARATAHRDRWTTATRAGPVDSPPSVVGE
ncbi:hypothetical protein Cus16_0906 [Curtobacterium sp. ER1/6]|nr:hypothetical protein Cus16_0906 [Curtobacterium sp. ER1/6]